MYLYDVRYYITYFSIEYNSIIETSISIFPCHGIVMIRYAPRYVIPIGKKSSHVSCLIFCNKPSVIKTQFSWSTLYLFVSGLWPFQHGGLESSLKQCWGANRVNISLHTIKQKTIFLFSWLQTWIQVFLSLVVLPGCFSWSHWCVAPAPSPWMLLCVRCIVLSLSVVSLPLFLL